MTKNKQDDYFIEERITNFHSEDHLNTLLMVMVKNRASGVYIKGEEPVWISLNNRKHKITKKILHKNECEKLLCKAYGSDTAITMLAQRGCLNFPYEIREPEGSHRFRVNAVRCTKFNAPSVSITFRLIDSVPPNAKDLGVPDDIIKAFRENEKGIIYVAGATGQGKSTLLASLLKDVLMNEDSNINLVDLGAPIEYVFDELDLPSSFVTSINIGKDLPKFSDGVENALRMEPQIIQISESRDLETISASIMASETGHAVTTTIHAGSVAESFRRIINMFPQESRKYAEYSVITSTKMIIAQKLVKTVDGKRTAIREYLVFTPIIIEKLLKSDNIALDLISIVEEYGSPMSKDIQRVFDEGLISEKEYLKQKKEYQGSMDAIKR